MAILITLEQARAVRRIAASYDTDEFSTLVQEVQDFYLRPLIGADLYNDVNANPTEANNVKLLDGENYTYQGLTYNYLGARKYLIYLFFYKYSLEGQVKYTNSGRQNVEVDYSRKSQPGIDAQVINNFRNKAESIGKDTLLYLERNSSDFPLYKSENISHKPNQDFNFTVIGQSHVNWKAND